MDRRLWLHSAALQEELHRFLEYIATEAEHHRKISIQDEVRLLLRRYEIEFDERYVWD